MAVTNVRRQAPTRVHQTRWRLSTIAALALAIGVTVERPARLAAAGVTVTTTAQGVDPGDGLCSLAEAIYAANFDAMVPSDFSPYTTMASECEAGNGDDVILLQPGSVYTMTEIENDPVMGPIATPVVLATIVIEARVRNWSGLAIVPTRPRTCPPSATLLPDTLSPSNSMSRFQL